MLLRLTSTASSSSIKKATFATAKVAEMNSTFLELTVYDINKISEHQCATVSGKGKDKLVETWLLNTRSFVCRVIITSKATTGYFSVYLKRLGAKKNSLYTPTKGEGR